MATILTTTNGFEYLVEQATTTLAQEDPSPGSLVRLRQGMIACRRALYEDRRDSDARHQRATLYDLIGQATNKLNEVNREEVGRNLAHVKEVLASAELALKAPPLDYSSHQLAWKIRQEVSDALRIISWMESKPFFNDHLKRHEEEIASLRERAQPLLDPDETAIAQNQEKLYLTAEQLAIEVAAQNAALFQQELEEATAAAKQHQREVEQQTGYAQTELCRLRTAIGNDNHSEAIVALDQLKAFGPEVLTELFTSSDSDMVLSRLEHQVRALRSKNGKHGIKVFA